MKTADFDFSLSHLLIAQHPAKPRDAARLLEVGDTLVDRHVRDLPGLLRPGDLLVFNDTKVLPVRLLARRGAAKIEITLLRRLGPGEGGGERWSAFARRSKKLHEGERVGLSSNLTARILAKREGGEIELLLSLAGAALAEELARHGVMPLPPYIKRPRIGDPADREDYQTMFARREGAVAAPTAGLHFTPALMEALASRGIEHVTVTLHVGAGTFVPVKADDPRDHPMRAEHGEVSPSTAALVNAARAAKRRIVAVGSTSLRLLESACDASGQVSSFSADTRLFILPGYQFRVADLMLTNFHLPRSTLFMLVCAFAGTERMFAAYRHAIAAGYRFYSYGDCCLLYRGDRG